ncbi:histidine--tRNA ligase [Cytophagaceae bacterium DM2B3-1]|uniref:Histidine--tRNA ligase n=1 Tax=Xanthocytophaga flava TaxID=3048013 RepID=A0ABT7CUW8_9BACT|nr:histidine--tRNA ligase [Xanthocytophaga flavus]MDJ1496717.1 histidine--tRNA ligase [Xanthocytophaga flavus]
MSQPSIPQGTRDFGPVQMAKRTFIFDTIKSVFQRFGFQPLETPTMENLSVLMGKYGDEGDQLLFKILNSALDKKKDHEKVAIKAAFDKVLEQSYTSNLITERGLRYDLTVPFARYVVMNRNDIALPFKRYQIQPVWRGDRPQKGRYREFYQCDADVVGTTSLLCEAEIVLMLNQALTNLGIKDFTIKINNRKILTGIAESVGATGKEGDLAVAIDKLDKIGQEKVEAELLERGFSQEAIQKLQPFFAMKGSFDYQVSLLTNLFQGSETGQKGLQELSEVMQLVKAFGLTDTHLEFDVTLARGLSYYTGAIFEVKAGGVQIGSICGGGRYDNLTGAFGVPGLSGVGISFGVDRIYDVMEELSLFPAKDSISTKVLITCFDKEAFTYALPILTKVREAGINAELYPDIARMKKQLDYADRKKVPFVVIIGSNEMATGKLALKNMITGEQKSLSVEEIIEAILYTEQ